MSDTIEQYRLMSISEASKAFKICREELMKCFHKGLKYKAVGTRKKVCLKWWIDYLESESSKTYITERPTNNKTGSFKMSKKIKETIYSIN